MRAGDSRPPTGGQGGDATHPQSPGPDREDPRSAHQSFNKYPLSYRQSPFLDSGNLAKNNKILDLKELLCQWEIYTCVYDVNPLDSWRVMWVLRRNVNQAKGMRRAGLGGRDAKGSFGKCEQKRRRLCVELRCLDVSFSSLSCVKSKHQQEQESHLNKYLFGSLFIRWEEQFQEPP